MYTVHYLGIAYRPARHLPLPHYRGWGMLVLQMLFCRKPGPSQIEMSLAVATTCIEVSYPLFLSLLFPTLYIQSSRKADGTLPLGYSSFHLLDLPPAHLHNRQPPILRLPTPRARNLRVSQNQSSTSQPKELLRRSSCASQTVARPQPNLFHRPSPSTVQPRYFNKHHFRAASG